MAPVLRDVALEVRRAVRGTAQTVNHLQTPAYYDELLGDLRFALAAPPPSFATRYPEASQQLKGTEVPPSPLGEYCALTTEAALDSLLADGERLATPEEIPEDIPRGDAALNGRAGAKK